ncbi:hypothetical protein [Vacuolonema iberomarrocanum]|uniref:hypothetical protein n=1 Tax=Vacuolonema iberomarrocanum TaxID=3454632 RepID=UPI0019F91FC4|nr:hypothetical protein [filamentous cyanobacterium LEGE 07170]
MMDAGAIRRFIISGTVIGVIFIGGFPVLVLIGNGADTDTSMIKVLLLGAASGFLMGLANGFMMRTSQFHHRLTYVFANILVDSVIGLIPLYCSAYILVSGANNGIVNGMALTLTILFFSLPPTVVTIVLMAVIVPFAIL